MLPPNSVMQAAERWLRVLRTSTVSQGWALIRADTNYTDLTQTQYASALEWLRDIDLLLHGHNGLELAPVLRVLPGGRVNELLFERTLERSCPPWLRDADILIPDASELPQDAAGIAATLGVSDENALLSVRAAHDRVDLEYRARVGLAGEHALLELLELYWPGSAVHVAATDDSFGYDILFVHEGQEWHLEVKATTRRGRVVIYLSRHEFEVGKRDPQWRLIVMRLGDDLRPRALATVRYETLVARAPRDSAPQARWQSASHELTPADIDDGLSFLGVALLPEMF